MSSEDKEPIQTTETQREETPAVRRRKRSVVIYLIVLFLVALGLLLMSMVMQQRSQKALEDISKTMSQSQDVATLQMENQRLSYELQSAQRDKEDLEKQLTEKEKETYALEFLRQIEAACRRSYDEARTLVEDFRASGLEEYLPETSSVDGAESPADTYRNLYAALF